MLQKWELSHYPSDKDKKRWRLKLKVEERHLSDILAKISGTVGRPFMLEREDFDFGIYIYDMKDQDVDALRASLQEACPDGVFKGPSKEENLDSLLDKVAKGIDNLAPSKLRKEKRHAKDDGQEVADGAREEPPRQPDAETAGAPEARDDADQKARTSRQKAPPQEKSSDFHDLELNANYKFDEFIIGPNNRFTAAAAQAVADNPGKIYNPFFIYGGVGLGKTHLMHAVGHYVNKKNSELNLLYVTTEKFMGDVIDSIRKGTLQQMRDHYRQVDLLLVDDIQFLVESESTQEEFFHTFNVLHQNGKQIIVTSDRPPKQLTTLEDRLRSRFEWGLIADIKSPNLETRVAILKKKGEIEHLKLDDNILLYIASKLKSNIRELEGFLKRINAYATLTHQEVNMELVQTLMSDLLPAEELEEKEEKPKKQAPEEAPAAPPQAPAARQEQVKAPPQPPAAEAPKQPQEKEIEEIKIVKRLPEQQPPATKPAPPPPPSDSESSLKVVEVAFFYPEGKDAELGKVKEHFREVIKKHKLKFQLRGMLEKSYVYAGKANHAFFIDLCKTNNISIAVVLGPPTESTSEAEDFANLLSTVMDDEKISLQMVPWAELNKDYRYLNLALDITLLKHKM
ncbi:MAG: chromosomal replication initiator protein DnaA [Endomicrobiales bacterium]|nr:chromosomal replication initiator protein DnaA [Endomicrobiales bacterium]